jgi:CheY-like chemotaxis protein
MDLDLPESMTMLGRYTLLQEVFLNLIDNASDAIRETKRANGLIIIHGEMLAGDRMRIQVSDNGKGIKREYLGRVFDPFFSTKDVGKGTGLGLSLVHSIVTDHAGRIHVESDSSSFTRFEIDFPKVSIVAGPAKTRARANAILRILVVDDEPAILSFLEHALGHRGHHVECTTTGSRALQLLPKNKFDVLLLDMHLPEMDGKSIIVRLRAMNPPVFVRTILITGDTMNEETRRFAQDFSLPMIMKPIDMERLSELLEAVVVPHS